ncbi:hypothetical protein [Streptomyces sp. MBT62]|uniref:hypothetical protein n=1 Tax=Streptomyces sp. MBT62 TaxID=2800410 RepID=UPI00190BF2E8|nr:hypothetical protein [Streptomyces sp. MBT62]MBK3567830.1 hypothetical protein [Streptomyces sp. MBT62]
MPLPFYEVDVPISNPAQPGLSGVHVFTGPAASTGEAVRLAHGAYTDAVAAQQAGLEIPRRRPEGWSARAVRPGWEPDWPAASAGPWGDPFSWRHPHSSDFDQ